MVEDIDRLLLLKAIEAWFPLRSPPLIRCLGGLDLEEALCGGFGVFLKLLILLIPAEILRHVGQELVPVVEWNCVQTL